MTNLPASLTSKAKRSDRDASPGDINGTLSSNSGDGHEPADSARLNMRCVDRLHLGWTSSLCSGTGQEPTEEDYGA